MICCTLYLWCWHTENWVKNSDKEVFRKADIIVVELSCHAIFFLNAFFGVREKVQEREVVRKYVVEN